MISATEPNLKATISEALPQTFLPILIPFACGYLTNYKLGDFDVTLPTSFGTIDIQLEDAVLQTILMKFAASQLRFVDPKYVELDLRDIHVILAFKYNFELDTVTHVGNGTLDVNHSNFTASIYFDTNSNGALQIRNETLSLTVGTVGITSDLGGVVSRIIDEAVKAELPTIEGIATNFLLQYIDKINVMLSNVNYHYAVPELNVEADLHAEVFKVVNSHLIGGVKGTIKNTHSGTVFPGNNVVLPDMDSTLTEQVQLFANSYVLNSILLAAADSVSYTISSLPPSIPLHLTTTGMAFLLPQLRHKFGDNLPVSITLMGNSTKTNSISVQNNLDLVTTVDLDFKVHKDNRWQQGVTLEVGLHLDLTAALSGTTVTGEVKTLQITDFSIVDSQVGEVSPVGLKSLFTAIVSGLQTTLNSALQGLEITFPKLPYLAISQADAKLKNGYLEAGVSIVPHFFRLE